MKMKFNPLASTVEDTEALNAEYRAAREIGKVRIGETILFFRIRLKTYYIPYGDVKRFFRRIHEVPLRTESFGGDLMIERRAKYGHHPHGVEVDETTIKEFFEAK